MLGPGWVFDMGTPPGLFPFKEGLGDAGSFRVCMPLTSTWGYQRCLGTEMIIARAQLLIIRLSLEGTRITSNNPPAARIATWLPLDARWPGNGAPG